MAVLYKSPSIPAKLPLPAATRPEQARLVAEHPFQGLYRQVAAATGDGALGLLGSRTGGLDVREARRRLGEVGPNVVAHEARLAWPRRLWVTAKNPFDLLLMLLAVVNAATGNWTAAAIVGVMVVLSVLLTFIQEHRSDRAAQRLQAMVTTTATVLRQEGEGELPLRELVPGDLVRLSAGDLVPADLRLVAAKDLFVGQAALTGEAFPVEKTAEADASAAGILELGGLCFMGTDVHSGTALGLVVKTGRDTYFGALAQGLSERRELTSFENGVNRFALLMLRFMLVMVPAVFLINGFGKGDWLQALLFAMAVAVGLTPEMLPMIVTVNLAKGALVMARKKVIVKRLNAIQNFGAMDVLCMDKTGTITADKVVLLKCVDPDGRPSERVLEHAFLNSHFQTGLKNLLDLAVLEHTTAEAGRRLGQDYRKVDEIPFDFQRRRMSVVVERAGGGDTLVTKGALEEVLGVCDRAELDGEARPLDAARRAACRELASRFNDDGLRVIAVGSKAMPMGHPAFCVADEAGMVLLGYLAFLDPPKDSAEAALARLRAHGVAVKVLTGDNERVTRRICAQVGIPFAPMLLGADIDAMDELQLEAAAGAASVFAKLSPGQKARIVSALNRGGHVVGFMGDGINDAPALKAADVGISVDNAVDIAKESADIILLEKSLLVLDEGVLEGRKVFGNILKYVKMGASSNFGNMFSVLGASLFLPFLPMLPTQLLAQNLLYDFSQSAIPFDGVDEEYLQAPRRWEIGAIGRFMLWFGPLSSLFDFATFAMLWLALGAARPEAQALFQTGWFVEGLLSQTLIVHIIRTSKRPFLQSRAAWPLLLSSAAIVAVGCALPYTGLGGLLGFTPLPAAYFAWLCLFLLGYALLVEWVKIWYTKKYGFH